MEATVSLFCSKLRSFPGWQQHSLDPARCRGRNLFFPYRYGRLQRIDEELTGLKGFFAVAARDCDDNADLASGYGAQAMQHDKALNGPPLSGFAREFAQSGDRHGPISVEGEGDDRIGLVSDAGRVSANQAFERGDRSEASGGFRQVLSPGMVFERGVDQID